MTAEAPAKQVALPSAIQRAIIALLQERQLRSRTRRMAPTRRPAEDVLLGMEVDAWQYWMANAVMSASRDGEPALEAETGKRSRWLLVPPPPLYAVSFGVGSILTRFLPLPLVPHVLRYPAQVLGVIAIVAAVVLIASAPLLFLRHRTTLVPHGNAQALVLGGPFRISRNPMYLGLTIAYLGVTLLRASAWPLLFLAIPLWVVSSKTIPFEEAAMTRLFGDEYRAYQRRVRRWL